MRAIKLFVIALSLTWLSQAHAGTILITEQEASLPTKPNITFDQRGITRAPRIEFVQGGKAAYSPMRFQLKFLPSGGTNIDLNSLRATYRKMPEIDISPRLARFASPSGIDNPVAEAPPGEHFIQIQIGDSEGRVRTSVFSLKVAP